MALRISAKVRKKLANEHGVTEDEIIQCFANRCGKVLMDTREGNKTDPPTWWFIAETDHGKFLKIVFMHDVETNDIHIKTAYEPNSTEKYLYQQHGM